MGKHEASEQMLGYVYQIRYALYMILSAQDDKSQICIEKFDDISIGSCEIPEIMAQLKHHTTVKGDLSDAGADLWRTLKVWIDYIESDYKLLEKTKFLIITTSMATPNSIAWYLRFDDNRNKKLANIRLHEIAENSTNKAQKAYYEAFLKLSNEHIDKLLSKIVILDLEVNVEDIEQKIREEIRYSCLPKYENAVFERIEGWWLKQSIQALLSEEPVFTNQSQVRTKLVSLGQEYTEDNLPIDIEEIEDISIESLSEKDKVFFEQLKLINMRSARMQFAIRDYYKAYKQRSNWIRDELIYVNELDVYEKRLISEWEYSFAEMQEFLEDYGDTITEKVKVSNGNDLFKFVQGKDLRIRDRCSEPFVMRGSYHILSNQLKVGWHTDFFERLKYLLGN
ncbi:MAG: hypothetical protein RSC48_05620 [Anaerorhabdus sp.]